MDDMKSEKTYIDILIQGLMYKVQLLDQLIIQTKEQEELLKAGQLQEDLFENTMDIKEKLIKQLVESDEGFEILYSKVSAILSTQKEQYKQEILIMQELIKGITQKGITIRALEKQNQAQLERCTFNERNRIKEYKVNSRTAANYYKNMNKQTDSESYFLDKKR